MQKILSAILVVIILQGCNKKNEFEYFGLTPPGNTPELFAPGFISLDNRNEAMITFSPDGKECYFTVTENPWNDANILETTFQDTAWTTPSKTSFISSMGFCPSISADGEELFFIGPYKNTIGVNRCTRTAEGNWSAPTALDSVVNSGQNDYSCHPSSLGSMFVCSWRSGSFGGCDGWRIPLSDGQYQKAENMGILNSKVGDCVWAPGPDEEFLIFQSRRPPTGNQGGFFETDLFITFAMPDGGWSVPQNLGSEINSSYTDGFAWVSHDGKYLFFSSDRNGTYDIYWVSLDSTLQNTPKIPITGENQELYDYSFYQIFDRNQTIIGFDLTRSGNVKLVLCNLKREELETILDEFKLKGENQFVWKGEGFEKGEYICKLQVSDETSGQVFLESSIQVLLR